MLNDQQILQDIHSLPPDGQAEVLDFIAFIKQKKSQTCDAAFNCSVVSYSAGRAGQRLPQYCN